MELPNADQLVTKNAELRQLISQITSRQTRGGGRYNKWETARLKFMRTSALPNLRLGKLPSPADERMLYLPASKDDCSSGPDRTAMEAWAQKWARDPRSKKPDDNLSEAEQTTLMQWAKNHGVPFVVPPRAAAGAPPSYKCASPFRAHVHTRIAPAAPPPPPLRSRVRARARAPSISTHTPLTRDRSRRRLDFGAYAGFTIRQMISASMTGKWLLEKAVGHKPGPYLLWLCGNEFEWEFPKHLYLFLDLREADCAGATVVKDTAHPGEHSFPQSLTLCSGAHAKYKDYCKVVLDPTHVWQDDGHDDGDDDDDDDDDAGGNDVRMLSSLLSSPAQTRSTGCTVDAQ